MALDGRAARALRTRQAIVDACVALIEAGDLRPTAPRVAERAGVSVRSVFQHFDDVPSLHIAVAQAVGERVAGLVAGAPDPAAPTGERLAAFVAQRAALLEALTPFRRAAQVHGPFSPEIRAAMRGGVAVLRHQVSQVFAPELAAAGDDRGELLEALAAASGWAPWRWRRR
jgi:TetR/AcrR family transcriptional regulator of autoinduction and epiphytic fitness